MSIIEKISVNAQSSIRIAADKIVYVDPYRIQKESHDGDVVLFSHVHHDHFSPADYTKIAKDDTVFVAPAEMESTALESRIKKENLVTLRPGDTCEILGITIEGVPAYNIGKPMHPKQKEWLGYVITAENTRIYACGDTDAIPEGKNVDCDIAMVPIGGTYTMNVEEAAEFVNEMKPKVAIPIHYGSVVGKPEDAYKFKDLISPQIQVQIVIPEA